MKLLVDTESDSIGAPETNECQREVVTASSLLSKNTKLPVGDCLHLSNTI